MSNRNLIASPPFPVAAPLPLDGVTIAALQRWCAGRNAQVIFNCDGTIYAATADDARHRQIHGDTFAFVLEQDR
jgi:hypothetical protein